MTEEALKGALIAGVLSGVSFWTGFKKLKLLRRAQDTATSRIASAPQGHVELKGFAWPIQQSSLTLDGQYTVYHRLTLQRFVKRGKKSEWVTVFTCGGPNADFYLIDATGAALVKVKEVEMHGETRTLAWRSLNANQRQRLCNYVGKGVSGFPPASGFFALFSSSFRVIENYVLVGSQMYAIGQFATPTGFEQPVEDLAMAHFAQRAHRLLKSPSSMKQMLDLNRDGRLSHLEVHHGFHMAARSSMQLVKSQPEAVKGIAPMICKGTLGSSSLDKGVVAAGDEQHFLKRMSYCWLLIAAGVVLLSISVSIIIGLFTQVR